MAEGKIRREWYPLSSLCAVIHNTSMLRAYGLPGATPGDYDPFSAKAEPVRVMVPFTTAMNALARKA